MSNGYASETFKITGIAPTIMHSGVLCDPLSEAAKLVKAAASKRKKTDEDFVELARLEFMGSLYYSERGRPCWPGTVLESMLISAAKKSKSGPQAKSGMMVTGDADLEYDGPTDPNELWNDPNFRLTVPVRVQTSRLMRTRPIFRDWSLKFTVEFIDDIVDRRDVRQWVETAGRLIGLSDWRPRYGRFVLAE